MHTTAHAQIDDRFVSVLPKGRFQESCSDVSCWSHAMTPEMHELFKTLWKDSKAKTTNIVIGQPKKKIVKPRKSKKCASANV